MTLMRFGQQTHPLNFDYGEELHITAGGVRISGLAVEATITCADIAPGCLRLRFDNARLNDHRQYSDGVVESYRAGRPVAPERAGNAACFVTSGGQVRLGPAELHLEFFASGIHLESASPGFGFSGEKFIVNFKSAGATGYYGFGERTRHLNKHGDRLDCWNVDVVATFRHSYERDDYDPAYVTIPLVIVKMATGYVGLYFDNPGRAVLDLEQLYPGQWLYQSLGGVTDLYVIEGPSLRQVVRRFSDLSGRSPLPPLWSLGYHQCRWGYASAAEFRALRDSFREHGVPVSALWFDIDYMDGYRLFTWQPKPFPEPAALIAELRQDGIRSVVIVDPGIKRETGYPVYDQGCRYACRTASGKEYIGRVWPGDVIFPDFTLPAARGWWAGQLAAFLRDHGIAGAWLDMNDPATGFSALEEMRFEQGAVPHDRYHNQYAHFMAKASAAAFDRLAPDGRPFLLTRSGFTGTQRYSAVWTGDNASRWEHLRMALPMTLNLGLSGMPFTGPDVGGFMGHTTAELLVRWYQAGFLFPFFRNHSGRDSKSQEPWQFGAQPLACIRAAIVNRYRLLPYLYTCFFEHWRNGDPVLRPLLYEYDTPVFESLDDQFLLGDALLVAPILDGAGQGREVIKHGKSQQLRHITLPPGWWFDLNRGDWLAGGQTLPYSAGLTELPWFVRDGAILPWYAGPLGNDPAKLDNLELHLFSRERPAALDYYVEDQASRAYQRGHYNTVKIHAELANSEVCLTLQESGPYPMGTVKFRPVLYGCEGQWRAKVIDGRGSRQFDLLPEQRQWLGKALPVLA